MKKISYILFVLLIVVVLVGCTQNLTKKENNEKIGGDNLSFKNVPNNNFIIGADMSFIQEQEDLGFVFIDNGVKKDIFEILKDHGFNYVRLRIFHNPGLPNGYQFAWNETRSESYCDLEHTIEIAKRAKFAGMGIFLDFHYSDTWAYPAEQRKPEAWINLTFDELRQAQYDYTKETLLAFKAEGVLPNMVQIGNEITSGILHPEGSTDDWDKLAQLLTNGITAVKDVDSNIKTVLHIDGISNIEETDWWVGEAINHKVPFDIMGLSAYYVFDGEPELWNASLQNLVRTYPQKEFIIAEYASHYREANEIVYNLPQGIGTFMWEPTENGYWGEGLFDMNWETMEGTTRNRINIYDEISLKYNKREANKNNSIQNSAKEKDIEEEKLDSTKNNS